MINLDQLRVFQAVAQARSFTRAAEVVHLTQPGISKHVRQMEQYFATPLFDRSSRKATLTEAGSILFEATQGVMAIIDVAEQRIEDLKGLRGGRLRLGTSFPIGVYLLPRVLAGFRKKYPAIEVTLDISLSGTIGPKILANEIDLGLASFEPRDPRLVAQEFMSDELIAIVPRDHTLAHKRHITPQELAEDTFIVAAPGAGTRTLLEERLRDQGIVLQKVLDFGNLEGVKHAVEAGLGISIQARSVVMREVASGSLRAVKLVGIDATIPFFYVCRKNAHLSHAAKALIEMLPTTPASGHRSRETTEQHHHDR
jgi:DNA-binding transcriptional LysR family regulator